jgi:hypothetical protein
MKSEASLISFKKNQKVMMVKVEDCEFKGAQGPFTIKDVDILFNTITLKETSLLFETDGIVNFNNDNYIFLTPVISIVKKK